MNTPDAQQSLDEALQHYADASSLILLEHSLAEMVSRRMHAEELRAAVAAAERGAQPGNRFVGVSLIAFDVDEDAPYAFPMGHRNVQDDEVTRAVVEHFQHACRWTLVAAYEVYEDFVRDLYARVGQLRPDLWRCRDFGDATIADVRGKPLAWFEDRARRARDVADHLRRVFPRLGAAERRSNWGCDVLTALRVVSELRHVIVHRRGHVNVDRIWKKFGFNIPSSVRPANSANEAKLTAYDMLTAYVHAAGDHHVVRLLDIPSDDDVLHGNSWLPLKRLLELLNAHAAAIYSAVLREFGGIPSWRRPTADAAAAAPQGEA